MNFVSKITTAEKKAIYERTIAEMEKRIINQILQLGVDPELFNDDTFTPRVDPITGDFVRGDQILREELDALAFAKQKYAEL